MPYFGATRRFKTEGPVVARDHYGIPPLEHVNLAEILELVRDKRYFVLHAPRQTGKTYIPFALWDLLNGGSAGRYRWVYVNVEPAQAAGRAIFLTSDHGHVLEADGVKLTGDAEGRWRSAASSATELEIEIAGARVLAATGRKRIVVPWSETVRYGSKKNGYHGGASLQEAVVPVGVFVGPGEQLDGWEPVASACPPWWHAEPLGPSRTDQPASAEPSAP